MGRGGVISFESNGAVVLVRGRGLPQADAPGVPRHARLSGDVSRLRPRDSRRAPARDEPRARDATITRSWTRSTPASPERPASMQHEHYDILIIGTRRGRRDASRTRSPPTGARILILERGDFVPQEDENWRSGGGLEAPSLSREGTLPRRAGQRVPAVHALRRRRQHQVLGQRPLPPAARRFPGDLEHADGLSPAWPIDYDTLAPYYDRAERLYHVHGAARRRSDRAAARSVSVRGRPAFAPAWRAIVEQLRASACILLRCRSGSSGPASPAAAACAIPAIRSRARFTQRATRKSAASSRRSTRPNVTLWTNAFARRLITTAGRASASKRWRSIGDGETVRVGADLFVVVVRRQSTPRRCCCGRRTAQHPHGLANSSGLVGRRYMAHLATMMQGFHPLRKNETVFQKTVGDQRLLSARPGYGRSRSDTSSRRDGRTA